MRLYAFWKHNYFPGCLGGEVEKIGPKGLVYVKSYQGWFEPLVILPYEEGLAMSKSLNALEARFDAERDRLIKVFRKDARAMAPWLGA